jgi:hypothetical protein
MKEMVMAHNNLTNIIRNTGFFQQPGTHDPVLLHIPLHAFKINIVQDTDLFPAGRIFG